MSTKIYDAIIIGGGPAGLSMAVALARQVYSVLIIDSREYRNATVKHMHAVPAFDHADPEEFRAKVRSDLESRYESVEYKPAKVKEVKKGGGDGNGDDGLFEVMDTNGYVYQGKKLGLATGVKDVFEGMPEGYQECWGKGIFYCLFCHGFEERGADPVGIFAAGMSKNLQVLASGIPMAKRLAHSATIYTNNDPALSSTLGTMFKSTKIHYDDRPISRFALKGGGPTVEVFFEDGSSKTEGFILNHPDVVQGGPFDEQLGLEMLPSGEIKTGQPFLETSLKGCFAAGDGATMMKSVVQATHMGSFAGIGMTMQLARELDAKDEL